MTGHVHWRGSPTLNPHVHWLDMSHKRKEKIYFVEEPTSEDTVCLPVYIMTNKSCDDFSLYQYYICHCMFA